MLQVDQLKLRYTLDYGHMGIYFRQYAWAMRNSRVLNLELYSLPSLGLHDIMNGGWSHLQDHQWHQVNQGSRAGPSPPILTSLGFPVPMKGIVGIGCTLQCLSRPLED